MHNADPSTQRGHRPGVRVLAAAALLVAVALLLAACGGGGNSPGVANVSTSTTSTGAHTTSTTGTATGGGGAPPVANPRPAGHSEVAMIAGNRTRELRFSECMRSHGEPSFPDPNAQGQLQFGSAQGIDPGSAQFKNASQRCGMDLLRHGQAPSPAERVQLEQQALGFSRCMRSHGVPNFPDPQFGAGGTSIRIGGRPGTSLDPGSPTFQAAQKACASNLPGKLGKLGAAQAPAGGGKQ